MKMVNLNYYFEVDNYDDKQFYFGSIVDSQTNKTIYDHFNALKSFAYREDMVFDLQKKCAEYGYVVENINDETYVPNHWEENL